MINMYRLKGREAFERVFREGQSWATPLLVVRASPNDSPHSRIAFSTSKRLGAIVARNRLKRRLREAARLTSFVSGWDIVLIAREASRTATFAQLTQALQDLLRRADLAAVTDSHTETSML